MKKFIPSLSVALLICFIFQPISAYAQMQTSSAPISETGKLSPAADLREEKQSVKTDDSGRTDQLARIFDFQGDVKVLKSDSEEWMPAKKGMVLEAGDQILTGQDGHLNVVYDNQFLNIARIEKNTKAEFRSIEPTDLFLEDGTIFNALDGLSGQGYQISTATAVAGVRGTELFTAFDAANQLFLAGVLDTTGVHSIELIAQNQSMILNEGSQMEIGAGEMPSPDKVEVIPAATLEHFQGMKTEILENREPSQLEPEAVVPQENLLREKDDENKAMGNDGPGGGGNDQAGFSSEGDALIDFMLAAPPAVEPPSNSDAIQKPEPNMDPKKKGASEEENRTSSAPAASNPNPPAPTMQGAMQFMALGSDQMKAPAANPADANASAVALASRIAAQWGMPTPAAQTLGQYFTQTTNNYNPMPSATAPMPAGTAGYVPPLAGSNNMAPAPTMNSGYVPPPANTPGYVPPGSNGGYVPPAGTAGYMPPAGMGYVPPGSNGGYVPPGSGSYVPPATGGGYVPPGGMGYMPPGSTGGYVPPAGTGYAPPPPDPMNMNNYPPPTAPMPHMPPMYDPGQEAAANAAALAAQIAAQNAAQQTAQQYAQDAANAAAQTLAACIAACGSSESCHMSCNS